MTIIPGTYPVCGIYQSEAIHVCEGTDSSRCVQLMPEVRSCDIFIDHTYTLQETSTVASGSALTTVEVPDDVANRMSLFYANPTPMLNALRCATEKLLKEVSHVTMMEGIVELRQCCDQLGVYG